MVAGVQRLISDPGFYCNTMWSTLPLLT
jgi:hypothetical protein